MGKSCDSFCPPGPYLVTKDEIRPDDLFIKTKVNNQIMQNGSTKTMIFKIPTLIAKLSEYFTLEAGDVILTGTPQGVQLENQILGLETSCIANTSLAISIRSSKIAFCIWVKYNSIQKNTICCIW